MLVANLSGVPGIESAGVNEFIIPNTKQTWAVIRKVEGIGIVFSRGSVWGSKSQA